MEKVARTNRMDVPSELITYDFRTNIYEALSHPGGIDFNTAAVWLNVYFGLTGSPYQTQNASVASLVIEQLLAYIKIRIDNGLPLEGDDQLYNFNDGSTNFRVDSCHYPPFNTP